MSASFNQPKIVESSAEVTAPAESDLSALPPPRVSRIPRWLHAVLPAFATIALGGVLLTTIYFTLLDWAWVTFLGGVLFAAVIALASRASRAEWAITSRTEQLVRLRDELIAERAARKIGADAARRSRARLRLFADAIPTMVAYIDENQKVHFHNRAFREWLGLRDLQVDGQLLSDVLGLTVYAEIQEKVAKALAGEQVNYERTQTVVNGATRHLQISYLPYFDDNGKPAGFIALLEDAASAHDGNAAGGEERVSGDPLVLTNESGQTLYLKSMTEQLTGWNDPEARLRRALERDEFRLYCQEIVPAAAAAGASGFYYEILLRLQEEEDNLTPPGAFISVAEQFNMTTDIDYWVVRSVINWHVQHRRDTSSWRNSMYFLNLFSSTIRDPRFCDYVRRQLGQHGVPPHVLCFEVNEEEAVDGLATVARFITDLRRVGCRTSLSGFGAGKVSFDMLKQLPVDWLKIDGDIVRNMGDGVVNAAKIKAIARVSKVIGMKTIAPFVESNDLRVQLADAGIDHVQGYVIGIPHSIEQLIKKP